MPEKLVFLGVRTACAASVFAILSAVSGLPAEAASPKLCALRDGPQGPCTCKTDDDYPGQFSVMAKKFCGAEPPKRKAGGEGDRSTAPADATNAAAAPAAADDTAAAPVEADTAATAETAGRESQSAQSKTAPAVVAEPAQTAPPPTSHDEIASPEVETAALPPPNGRLDEVRKRGKILCGVNTDLRGFSSIDSAGVWSGLDVEFCHALAVAVFGDGGKAEFVPLETNERFDALKDGRIDILARNTTWTMSREVDLGLRFAGILYFDGQGFMTGSDRGLVSAHQLSGSTVCVEGGTTSEKNMEFYFKTHGVIAQIKSFPTRAEMLKAYVAGTCDAYSGDRSALFSDRITFLQPEQHVILPEVISKEPLGPAVLKADDEWAEIVRWTLAGLINAEEVGLNKAAAAAGGILGDDAQRLVDGAGGSGEKLRLNRTWLRDVIAAVGNYGEMFDANIGKDSVLGMERGLNALWKRGGILSAPPMW